MLPGLTARMWRARLLTFAALAAQISDRVVEQMNGRDEVRLEARLALERLFVSALVYLKRVEENGRGCTVRVSGIRLEEMGRSTPGCR